MYKKKKILILNGQYAPGYKGGGPIQSCINMVENLWEKFEFYVLTADRDLNSEIPYKGVNINEWNKVGHANVFYMSTNKQNIRGFNEILDDIEFDIMYLNGFFSPVFTIKPLILRLLGKFKNKKIIITPRGDFTGGCENKKLKKYTYIYFCKLIGLYSGLVWHATSELEALDIRKKFKKAKIVTISNLSEKYKPKDNIIKKQSGELKLVFISRIFPKKNLKYALEILKEVKCGDIKFDIYGPMEDEEYWYECQTVIKSLPPNINVEYKGEIEHSEVKSVFSRYHAFFFPTLGENYGHVIVEAMMSNCLCILSKQVTPWDEYINLFNLGANLSDKESFIQIINNLVKMEQREYTEMLYKSRDYISKIFNHDNVVKNYEEIFLDLVSNKFS